MPVRSRSPAPSVPADRRLTRRLHLLVGVPDFEVPRHPHPFGRSRPDPTDAAFAAAGAGSGLSGPSAANALGLSTQVPRQPVVAVVGRPPKGLRNIRFVNHSNPHRINLNHMEIAFLEVLAGFDNVSEIDWPTALTRLRRIAYTSGVDLRSLGIVARHERRKGIADRLASLASA